MEWVGYGVRDDRKCVCVILYGFELINKCSTRVLMCKEWHTKDGVHTVHFTFQYNLSIKYQCKMSDIVLYLLCLTRSFRYD